VTGFHDPASVSFDHHTASFPSRITNCHLVCSAKPTQWIVESGFVD
jgi:hypothetical protein